VLSRALPGAYYSDLWTHRSTAVALRLGQTRLGYCRPKPAAHGNQFACSDSQHDRLLGPETWCRCWMASDTCTTWLKCGRHLLHNNNTTQWCQARSNNTTDCWHIEQCPTVITQTLHLCSLAILCCSRCLVFRPCRCSEVCVSCSTATCINILWLTNSHHCLLLGCPLLCPSVLIQLLAVA